MTGFDNGEMFTDDDVREYFTVENMTEMFGGNLAADYPDLTDQDYLDEMAETVIRNGWHITG